MVDDGNSLPNKVDSDSDTLYLAHWPFKINTYMSIHEYILHHIVEARDVEQFKAELDEAWKDIRFLHTAL